MSEDTKCLIITTHYLPIMGGAQKVYDGLARSCPDQVEILSACIDYRTGKTVDNWRQADAGKPYTISRMARLRANLGSKGLTAWCINIVRAFFMLTAIWWYIKKRHIDVICIASLDSVGWSVKPLRWLTKRPVMLYIHGEEVSQKPYSRKAGERRVKAIQHADAIVAVSRFTSGKIASLDPGSEKKIAMIGNGTDIVEEIPSVAEREKYVFAAGRIVERKGFDRLLEAWPQVLKEHPDAKLGIAGTGPYVSVLNDLITKNELETSVTLLGEITDAELREQYGRACLFAMPNRTLADGDTEGFGLVFLEAAAWGVPSVAGRDGGVSDAVINGETGCLVDGRNSGQIAEVIIRLLSNDDERLKMAKAAREHAYDQRWELKAMQFKELLVRVCQGKVLS